MKRLMIFAPILFAACGGAEAPVMTAQVGFKVHALKCDRDGLLAKMQVQVEGGYECPLLVNADRTVQGSCSSIPTGAIREFRLIYFAKRPGEPDLDVATALTEADLRGYTRAQLRVEFPQASINTDIDDDQDGKSNIVEWCSMENPRGP